MFLGSLPYALFRFLACDPYVSFELTLTVGTLCGYVSMIYLLKKCLDAGEMLSIAGAAIFSLLNVSHLWILSAQTYTVMLLPSLLILFLQLAENSPKARLRPRLNSFVFCALVSLLYFSTFYVAYFFSLLFILALAIYPLVAPVTSWRSAIPRPSVLLAGCFGLTLGLIPFFFTYGSSIATNHGWEFSEFFANAMGVQNLLPESGAFQGLQ